MSQPLVNERPVTFGTAGNYKDWAVSGWSQDQDQTDFTWMDGFAAALEFMMQVPSTDLLMTARLMPFDGKGVKQHVQIFLNGRFVEFWAPSASEFLDYSTIVRRAYFLKDAANTLTFVAPHAISPAELNLSLDQRRLSLAFMQLNFQDPTRRQR
jgi:hypothetical protein